MNTTPNKPAASDANATEQRATDASAASVQRQALLDSERRANAQQPRNFKDDALSDKIVSVKPDGTGPTSTESFDPATDQASGSGNKP